MPDSSAPWQITLFGTLRAQRGGQSITRFKYQKVGCLLAYLAYDPRRMHAREVLVEMFWPDSPPGAARNNLSTALSSLRNQFEPPGPPAGAVLKADRYSVGLNPTMVTTDVAEFEAALKEAATAKSATERREHGERAFGLYQGRLLPGFYDAWIAPEQERLDGLFFDAASMLIGLLQEQGDLPGALRYARQAAGVDPLREEAQEHLTRLLVSVGQPGAALRQYKEFERLLEAELGEEPSAALRALYRQIERQSWLTAPSLPAPVAPPVPLASPPASLPVPPNGQPTTLTFLLTGIAGAAGLEERAGDAFQAALTVHQATLRKHFTADGGLVIRESGEGFVVAFPSARQALTCAVACQQALRQLTRPEEAGALRVRMAVHTGDVEFAEGEYRGPALHRASCILAAGHGGQILVSQATAELAGRDLPDEIRLVDLGLYRLWDVPTPERLHQVDYPGMPEAGFPAPDAQAGQAAHLPVQVTRFFGREQEILRIEALLRPEALSTSDEVRLLTLSGTGGTGKTRLAIAAAERLAESYQGAVWFVPLAGLSEDALIAGAIREAMRLPASPREPLEQVADALLAQQSSLLILDNFEHLVENGASLVQTLLERVASLTVLVTSRQVLGLSAEREFAVLPLPTPNGPDSPERLSLFDSVALFVDRAQAVKPDFQVSNHNAPAVAELCDRLEGIPLALELAAARAQVLTPAQMLQQLAHRFEFLSSRRRDVSERQKTLRGAIDWSYRLLAPDLQRFFARLSVFRGGWSVEATEAVCEEPLALDYLAMLREASLVLSEETAQGMRFRMLETMREFAHEQLESPQSVLMRSRLQEWLLSLAQGANPHLTGPDQAGWFDRLDAEYQNLSAGVTWATSEGLGLETMLETILSLGAFLHFRDHHHDAYRFPRDLLARGGESLPENLRARTLCAVGAAARHRRDYDVPLETSRALLEESLTLARRLGDKRLVATVLESCALTAYAQEDMSSARPFLLESFTLWKEVGDSFEVATSLFYVSYLAHLDGDRAQARTLLSQSMDLVRPTGNPAFMGDALLLVAELTDDYTEAQSVLDEAIQMWEGIGRLTGVGTIHVLKAERAMTQGEYGTAARHYRLWLETVNRRDRRVSAVPGPLPIRVPEWAVPRLREVASKVIETSLAELAAGHVDSSRAPVTEAVRLLRLLEDASALIPAVEALARVEQAQSHYDRAIRLRGAAAALRTKSNVQRTAGEQAAFDVWTQEMQQAVGETDFQAVWAQGHALSIAAVIRYALEEIAV